MPLTFVPFLFLLISGLFGSFATAQLVNGQYFTRGLAISNAPAPNSEFTVGGTISVSVDVSGNGQLPQASWGPNSTLPSGFISLSIYLVSGDQNVTVVDGTTGAFLAGEPGSTVKHLNYAVPSCLPAGNYDYTYYEVSRMNGTTFFGITPIPITVKNPGGSSGACDANISNPVRQRPQNDSAPAQNPFTGGLALNTTNGAGPSNTATMAPAIPMPSASMNPTQTMEMATYDNNNNHNNNNAQAAFQTDILLFPIRTSAASSLRTGMAGAAALELGILPLALLWTLSAFGA